MSLGISFVRIFLLILFCFYVNGLLGFQSTKFHTRNGLEPSKWSSVWLIENYITPEHNVTIHQPKNDNPNTKSSTYTNQQSSQDVTENIPFDLPEAKYRRTHGQSTYTSLTEGYNITDPTVLRIGQLIHDIEIAAWGNPIYPETDLVEERYRALQFQFDRVNVPRECYNGFFDTLSEQLKQYADHPDQLLTALEQTLTPANACADLITQYQANSQINSAKNQGNTPLVPEANLDTILSTIAAGYNVHFIDVRETSEFEEGHIPGASNMKLREINQTSSAAYKDDDLVVAYCVKDFRGFEAAKALRDKGVKQAVIMNPYGIKGWHTQGLPIAGDNGLSEADAMQALLECAKTRLCLNPNKTIQP